MHSKLLDKLKVVSNTCTCQKCNTYHKTDAQIYPKCLCGARLLRWDTSVEIILNEPLKYIIHKVTLEGNRVDVDLGVRLNTKLSWAL